MANRPWVTPQEVYDYSEIAVVQVRPESKVKVDIIRAEQYVIAYTNNGFEDYETIPEPVKAAVLLLAEAYAYNSTLKESTIKSETFDDYSYTAETTAINIDDLDLAALLDPYIIDEPRGGVFMRLRKL